MIERQTRGNRGSQRQWRREYMNRLLFLEPGFIPFWSNIRKRCLLSHTFPSSFFSYLYNPSVWLTSCHSALIDILLSLTFNEMVMHEFKQKKGFEILFEEGGNSIWFPRKQFVFFATNLNPWIAICLVNSDILLIHFLHLRERVAYFPGIAIIFQSCSLKSVMETHHNSVLFSS